jgi:hypothetical protein
VNRTVKQVSELAGISVRTLHYYDEIERFKAGIDAHGEGLTAFLCAAITANAGRAD